MLDVQLEYHSIKKIYSQHDGNIDFYYFTFISYTLGGGLIAYFFKFRAIAPSAFTLKYYLYIFLLTIFQEQLYQEHFLV